MNQELRLIDLVGTGANNNDSNDKDPATASDLDLIPLVDAIVQKILAERSEYDTVERFTENLFGNGEEIAVDSTEPLSAVQQIQECTAPLDACLLEGIQAEGQLLAADALLEIKAALAERRLLSAEVLEVNNGGVVVGLFGQKAFCPNSSLIKCSKKHKEALKGKQLNVLVTEVRDPMLGRSAVVVSQKLATIREMLPGLKVSGKVIGHSEKGMVVELPNGLRPFLRYVELARASSDPVAEYPIGTELPELKVLHCRFEAGSVQLTERWVKAEQLIGQSLQAPITEQVIDNDSGSVKGVIFELFAIRIYLPLMRIKGGVPQIGQRVEFCVRRVICAETRRDSKILVDNVRLIDQVKDQ